MSFTASQLYNAQNKLDEMFMGKRFDAHLNKPCPSLIAALERQTAKFNPILTETRETRGVEVSFITGDITVNDSATTPVESCTVGGEEAATAKIVIQPTEDQWVEFLIMDNEVNNKFTIEDLFADRMARSMSELRVKWNNKILAWWNSNIMLPTLHAGDGTLSGNVVQVAKATLSSADYIATAQAIAEENDVYDAFMISARMFWIEKYKSMFKTSACCSVDALFDGPFDIVFDLKNLDSMVGTDAVLMIDPGSYAIWSHNDFFNDTPEDRANSTTTFRMKDPILSFNNGGKKESVYYDVIVQKKCVISQDEFPVRERWGTAFRIHKRWGKSLAPDPGGFGSGIIEFNGV